MVEGHPESLKLWVLQELEKNWLIKGRTILPRSLNYGLLNLSRSQNKNFRDK